MSLSRPHFLLFLEVQTARQPTDAGEWKFALEAVDGSTKIEASDAEWNPSRERLELLAVIRGLEALEQPSRVTIVTASRFVGHGIRFGLSEWRANNFHWEHFDQVVPVPNDDLWRRIDQALKYHSVECRVVQPELPPETAVQVVPEVELCEYDTDTNPGVTECHVASGKPAVTERWPGKILRHLRRFSSTVI